MAPRACKSSLGRYSYSSGFPVADVSAPHLPARRSQQRPAQDDFLERLGAADPVKERRLPYPLLNKVREAMRQVRVIALPEYFGHPWSTSELEEVVHLAQEAL